MVEMEHTSGEGRVFLGKGQKGEKECQGKRDTGDWSDERSLEALIR